MPCDHPTAEQIHQAIVDKKFPTNPYCNVNYLSPASRGWGQATTNYKPPSQPLLLNQIIFRTILNRIPVALNYVVLFAALESKSLACSSAVISTAYLMLKVGLIDNTHFAA